MLYHLHELQRAFLTPLAAFTDASSQLFSSPFSPLAYTPLSRQLAASCELMHRLGKEYQKPAWNLPTTRIDNRTVRVTETAAIEKPFCRLLHFERAARRTDPRVLLVAPLSGHHATLLRDTVRALLPAHDVYVTDWLDARMVPVSQGRFHLDDYVRYIQEFIRYLGPDVHVISVCQPTVPVLAAIALMASENDPHQPRSMVMMGGPIDPRQSPTQVNRLATTKPHSWFESQLIDTVPAPG
jgi:poly(3-hydroxybutyrate) depolymerase